MTLATFEGMVEDVALPPHVAATRLGATVATGKRYELLSVEGNAGFAPIVQLELVFCLQTRRRFLPTDQASGVLGRDILNTVILLLGGSTLMWREPHSG